MQEYVTLTSGHMEFLIRALDGDTTGLGPSPLPPLPTWVDPLLVQDAVAFLQRTSLPIEPRKQWPTGGLPTFGLTGKIQGQHLAEPGRALCVWGDAGWGSLTREGKYGNGRFDDQLVAACVALCRAWHPEPAPTWVTCVPSLRHPALVPDFAARLANALGLSFYQVLAKTDTRPEQKAMANSLHQARNVDGSFAIPIAPLPSGPVLLVDDMVGSRWTLTVATWLLRSSGSGQVWPLALAMTGGDE